MLGQLFDREHLLADVFDVLIGRVGQILDEQMQIVQQWLAGDLRPGERLGPIAGDAEADVLISIRLLGVDLTDQPIGGRDLLRLLIVRRDRICWSQSCLRLGLW